MVYCSCCDKDLEEGSFDVYTGVGRRSNFRGDLLERFCRHCTFMQSSIPDVGCVYGFFSGDSCVYVGSTHLVDWMIRIREHWYSARVFPEYCLYGKTEGLVPRLLQYCNPHFRMLFEYGWQLAKAPEGRELPLYNRIRAHSPLSGSGGPTKVKRQFVTGMYRLEFTGTELVVHFDEPRPWPYPVSGPKTAALLADSALLKDYLFGRVDIAVEPPSRPCLDCGCNCQTRRHCPWYYMWEATGKDPAEDPSLLDDE